MKKILSLILLVLLPLVANAYDAMIEGIYYNLDNEAKTAEVTPNPNYYSDAVNIPASVTYKGKEFRVTSIGYGAFSSCYNLTSVTIPDCVTSICNNAFRECKSLTSITIPNSVTSIGINAFYGCYFTTDSFINNSSLTSSDNWGVTLCEEEKGDGLMINNNCVINCRCWATAVSIPNSVTSIGDHAFSDCTSLTSVTIPNSVTSIGQGAFLGCSALTSVIIGNSVTSIEPYTFAYSGLTSITIPNSVTSIGNSAFYDCTGLTSVIIPNSVMSIGKDAFSVTEWYDNQSDGLIYLGRIAYKYKGEMPDGTQIVINNGTLGIAGGAFYGCSGLTSVTIPNSVTNIGNYAFRDCSSLTSVTIPNSVTNIGDHAFEWCSSLTSIIIPNSVTSIGTYAFGDCRNLASVTIPNSVTSIGDYTFYECSSLTSVVLDNDAIVSASSMSFIFGEQVKTYILGNSVTSIGDYAFSGCSGLTSIDIPNSVTSIGYDAFSHCYDLTSVTIPDCVTSISDGTFNYCESLTSVTIPNSVTSIGHEAFSFCTSLISVTIGNNVETIGIYAFGDCIGLTDVYCYATEPPIAYFNGWDNSDYYSFDISYIHEHTTLHVPEGSIELYKATEPWSNFGKIVVTDGDTPEPPKPEICATPTISYANGKLTFNCETEGAECVATVSDTDIKTHYGNEISLTATYTITVYATKDGYENSEVATGTLCWIDVAPKTEGIVDEDAVTEVKAMPVLIQSQGGTISIQGAAEGTPIAVYDIDGKQYGSTIAEKDRATITTSLRPGSVAIVKIGEKAVKVVIK